MAMARGMNFVFNNMNSLQKECGRELFVTKAKGTTIYPLRKGLRRILCRWGWGVAIRAPECGTDRLVAA
jgi:hypothetical protein